jgi:hypothetical protein
VPGAPGAPLLTVHALADVRRLLLDVHQHLAGVAVEANILGDEADLPAGLAHDGLVVDLGLGGNLTEDHHHASLGGGLAGDLRGGRAGGSAPALLAAPPAAAQGWAQGAHGRPRAIVTADGARCRALGALVRRAEEYDACQRP